MKVGKFTTNIAKKAVNQLGKPGALLPVILLEVAVDSGRAYQAKKRGGYTEMRERVIDDVSAGVFWLFGANMCNKFGNWIGNKFLKIKNPVFSTGRDKARDCLKQGFAANPKKSPNLLSAFKFSKVVLSIAAAVTFIGWCLPKINQAITKKLLNKESEKTQPQQNTQIQQPVNYATKVFDDFNKFAKPKNSSKPSFGLKLSPEFVGQLAHNLEHNATYRLAATDGGILVGRTTNARTFDEGLEYGFRDVVSSYFYLFATNHIIKGLRAFDKYKGKNTDIDPHSAVKVNNYLAKIVGDKSMPVEEFEKKMFGTLNKESFELIKDTLQKNGGNITVEDFCKLTNADKELTKKAQLMSKLQPKMNGMAILTDKQAADVLTDGAVYNPRFLYRTINGYFGEAKKQLFGKNKGKITVSNIRDNLTFTSISDIEKFQGKVVDYVQSVAEMAKNQAKKSGKPAEVSLEVIKKAAKRNSLMHSSFLITGLGISALFLSTFIPKLQYWITKKRTGKDGFPGVNEAKA